jgi:hypothetical protein
MIYNQILSERLEIGSHNLGGHLIQIKKDVARYVVLRIPPLVHL